MLANEETVVVGGNSAKFPGPLKLKALFPKVGRTGALATDYNIAQSSSSLQGRDFGNLNGNSGGF